LPVINNLVLTEGYILLGHSDSTQRQPITIRAGWQYNSQQNTAKKVRSQAEL